MGKEQRAAFRTVTAVQPALLVSGTDSAQYVDQRGSPYGSEPCVAARRGNVGSHRTGGAGRKRSATLGEKREPYAACKPRDRSEGLSPARGPRRNNRPAALWVLRRVESASSARIARLAKAAAGSR